MYRWKDRQPTPSLPMISAKAPLLLYLFRGWASAKAAPPRVSIRVAAVASLSVVQVITSSVKLSGADAPGRRQCGCRLCEGALDSSEGAVSPGKGHLGAFCRSNTMSAHSLVREKHSLIG